MRDHFLLKDLEKNVEQALAEDIGSGDITSELIPVDTSIEAQVICREHAIICGQPWVDETFKQVDPKIQIQWLIKDGDSVSRNDCILKIKGKARSILSAERTALNFLQTLSSVATRANTVAQLVSHTAVKILDTRKTIPGLRLAQKYAVTKGGCFNHRLGLYDAYLIKENHIAACGGITDSINRAKELHPGKTIEVEVETLEQMQEALQSGADIILLDNFNLEGLKEAVRINDGQARLEASGGYDHRSVVAVAETGVDYISVGSLTKHCKATDLTMLIC